MNKTKQFLASLPVHPATVDMRELAAECDMKQTEAVQVINRYQNQGWPIRHIGGELSLLEFGFRVARSIDFNANKEGVFDD